MQLFKLMYPDLDPFEHLDKVKLLKRQIATKNKLPLQSFDLTENKVVTTNGVEHKEPVPVIPSMSCIVCGTTVLFKPEDPKKKECKCGFCYELKVGKHNQYIYTHKWAEKLKQESQKKLNNTLFQISDIPEEFRQPTNLTQE